MGKKTTPDSQNKKSRPKHKDLFSELATHKEEAVKIKKQYKHENKQRVINQDSQDDVELDVLQHNGQNMDDLCDAVQRLLSKNKVSAKNAFDVPFIDLQKLPDFSQSYDNENAWKRLSSTLQSDYKIYAYRVDAIHSITYNILNAMARRQQQPQQLPAPIVKQQQQSQVITFKQGAQLQHLQRRRQNLDVSMIELASGVDPILQRTKRKFDLLGQNSYLMDSLSLDDYLTLQLVNRSDKLMKYPVFGQHNGIWTVDQQLNILNELSDFRGSIQQNYEGKMRNEYNEWALINEKQNRDENIYFDYENQMYNRKSIDQLIHLKKRIKNNIEVEDDQKWMDDVDRKFLGMIKKPVSQPKVQINIVKEIKQVDPADIIDFLGDQLQQKDMIFRKENPKQQHYEDIQDKYLLTSRLHNSFYVNKLTLLTQTVCDEHFDQRQVGVQMQVDVRRQNVSILEAKQKIKMMITQRSTFTSIYQNYAHSAEISPALCFLTILHLANQHSLMLQSIDESNFYVH